MPSEAPGHEAACCFPLVRHLPRRSPLHLADHGLCAALSNHAKSLHRKKLPLSAHLQSLHARSDPKTWIDPRRFSWHLANLSLQSALQRWLRSAVSPFSKNTYNKYRDRPSGFEHQPPDCSSKSAVSGLLCRCTSRQGRYIVWFPLGRIGQVVGEKSANTAG